MSTSNADRADAGWWESPATESCPFCEQVFTVEVLVHCVECDRPVCPLCAITVRQTRQRRCPDCGDVGEGD